MKNMHARTTLFSRMIGLLLLLTCAISFAFAQNVREIKKQNKEYIKVLKLQGYKSVKVQTGDNGFWYFLVGKKVGGEWKYGVISKDREVLFDCHYTSVTYIPQIEKAGYTDYSFRRFEGGWGTVSIYNHAMPGHFTLYDAKTNKTRIALVDGSILKDFTDDYYRLGSWIITNLKLKYTRFDGKQRLWLLNKETKDMGMMTWDGKVLAKNENNLIVITSKNDVTYNGVWVYCDYYGLKVGGFFLEDPTIIAPTIYDQVSFDYEGPILKVKLSPTDKEHVYNPNVNEEFIPKNKGEEYYNKNKYKECLEYYAKGGAADPDSKFYSAHAMFNLAYNQIMMLENHIAAPPVNSLDGYDYNESKHLLLNAIKMLQLAATQDAGRKDIYDENIELFRSYLNRLETGNVKLAELRKKENNFGNVLARSILTGLAEGIVNSASKALFGNPSSGNANTPVASTPAAQPAAASKKQPQRAAVSSAETEEPESESSSSPAKSAPKYRECGKCGGKGELFSTSTNATYGMDKKVTCSVCGEVHWASTVHIHKKCYNCNGTGKVRM